MKKHWNDPYLKKVYEKILHWAKNDCIGSYYGFTDKELSSTYISWDLDSFKTKSHNVHRMIMLAFYLGQLRGVAEADEMREEFRSLDQKNLQMEETKSEK